MIVPTEIRDLFENIATTHPGIGHVAGTTNRFYGYNNDEAIGGENNDLEYPRMGLSLKTHSGLFGTYINQQSAMQDNLSIEISLLRKTDQGDFATEYEVYDAMKVIMDDIVTWLQLTAQTDANCDWPAVHRLDLSSIQYNRIGPVHTNAYGWRFLIRVQDSIINRTANPLNTMTP